MWYFPPGLKLQEICSYQSSSSPASGFPLPSLSSLSSWSIYNRHRRQNHNNDAYHIICITLDSLLSATLSLLYMVHKVRKSQNPSEKVIFIYPPSPVRSSVGQIVVKIKCRYAMEQSVFKSLDNLGKPTPSKTDEFSEKFRTAFEAPPHFRKVVLQIFSEIHDRSIVYNGKNQQHKFLDWKWPPPPFGTFPKTHSIW